MPPKDLDAKWNVYHHPNVCVTVIHRIISLTKSNLDNYTGKHVYHKNHRRKKYYKELEGNSTTEINFIH